MASEVRIFEVTVPAGTTSASPQVSDTSFPPRSVESIEIRVPPGPSGLVGFRVTMAGNPVIPVNTDEWVITDNEIINWPLTGYPDSGAWQVTAYNTDIYDHTIYVRFLLNQVTGQAATASPALIPSASLAAVPDASQIPAINLGA